MCSWQLETQDGSTRIYRPGLDTQIFRERVGKCGCSYGSMKVPTDFTNAVMEERKANLYSIGRGRENA